MKAMLLARKGTQPPESTITGDIYEGTEENQGLRHTKAGRTERHVMM